MSVQILIPTPLQRYSQGERSVAVEARDAGAALTSLFEVHPELRLRVLDGRGQLFPYLLLFRNREQLARSPLSEIGLEDGDLLDIVAAVEGGSGPPASSPGSSGPLDVRMRGFRARATVKAAQAAALDGLAPLAAEELCVTAVAGRVLAADIESPVNVPPFERSAMDGFAVRAADTFGASIYDPLALRLVGESMPGADAPPAVEPGEACRIMTGARVPPGADAVLKAEDAEERDGEVLARAPVPPLKNIGRVGEDVKEGEQILATGRLLRPQDAGLLASIGVGAVPVARRPRVRVLVSGNELLPPGSQPQPGRIVDSNTPMLEALIKRDGGEVAEALRLPDEREALRAALCAPGVDLVLAAGGSSVGREDWLPVLVRELGELPIHGVAMRPSAPTGVGTINGTRVVLLPGNPVSCLCAYDFFASPALRRLAGLSTGWPYPRVQRPLARRIASQVGRLDYVRVKLIQQGGQELALPLAISGAGVLSSTTKADAFAVIPGDSEGLAEGESVSLWLYDPLPTQDDEQL